jgi:hypothetical protein
MHFVSEASKHAKLNEVEPDIPIRRIFTYTILHWQVWKPALLCLPKHAFLSILFWMPHASDVAISAHF